MNIKKTAAFLLAIQMVFSSVLTVNAEITNDTLVCSGEGIDDTSESSDPNTGEEGSSDELEGEEQENDEAQQESDKETDIEDESEMEEETSVESEAEEESTKARTAVGREAAKGLKVEGGELGRDYTYENGVLTILTSTSLTISNNNSSVATSDRIVVPVGVSANIIFAGVNITTSSSANASPFTLMPADSNGASAHITLADNTINKLTSGTTYYPGLRCGRGTSVTIDDSILNQDANGQIVPELGRIPYDTTLVNGTSLKKGDRLTLMDSANPGTLIVKGSSYASGLGGGNQEDGGNITINGGKIEASTTSPTAGGAGNSGAGIGGGCAGGGGNITINGGEIKAQGAYHAAGIGGGYANTYNSKADSALKPLAPYRSGNITINGGTSYSYGGDHGNAFGDGCYGTSPNCALKFTVKVTGGTIIAKCGTGLAEAKDLGGSKANVIVLGGSLKANTFQSINGQVAYGDEALQTQVFMTKINLSGDAWAKNQLVDSLKLTVGGEEKVYGLPANVDEEGCLYLWLPKTGQNKEIRATLSVMHTDGTAKEMEPFFIKDAVHNSLLKRYAGIEIPDSFFKTLEKVYDGRPIETNAVETAGLVSKEIEPRPINKADKISYTAQRLDEDNNEISEEETRSLPIDAGKWQITVTSDQYSTDANFSNSYWGHRGYYKSVLITRAQSKTTVSYERTSSSEENPSISNKKVKLNAVVSPAENEARTCASPTGKVQFYVNGKAVGQPVELTPKELVNEEGYHYSEASYEWTPSAEDVVPSSDRYNVTAKYIGDVHGVNYKSSEGTSGEKLDITPIKQETAITIKDVTVADDPKDVTDQEISYKFTDGSCTLKAEGGNSSEDFVYKSSDSSIAEIDSATGKVIFKDFGTVTITVTKPGNAAYKEKSEKVTLIILPSAPARDDLNVTKTAENTTDPGAPTQVNDVIKYKISAENKLLGSLWKNISIKDYIPVGMDLDENSLYLLHPDGTETKLVGSFYDKKTRLLEVEIGDVRGGEKYSLCFDVRINAEAVGKDIGNITEASGTTPDGEVVGGGTSTPVYPSEEDTPDNGGVLWGNPTPGIEKTAENKTHDGAATTVSDRITYTIKVENKKQGSVWKSVSIRDRIPEGLLVDTDSMYLTTTEGTEIHVDPTAYREQERMISVYVGDVYGGEKYIFRFDVFVQADAIGKDIGNEAIAIGKNPDGSNGIGGSSGVGGSGTVGGTGGSSGVGGSGTVGGTGGTGSIGGTGGIWSGGSNGWSGGYTGGPYTIGSPYYPEDDPYTSIEEGSGVTTNGPVYPWDDDEEGAPEGVLPGNAEPELGKTVTNETTKDGSTKENDILTYEIELTNPKVGTLWKNVMIFDYLPEELELDVSSLVLIYPNGVKKKVSANVYNSKTHMINVPIAELWGGETYILRYKVKVVLNEDEESKKEIVNRAEATGENPDGTVTDAGKGPTSSVAVKYPEVVKKSDTIQNTGKTEEKKTDSIKAENVKTDSAKVNGNKTNSIKTGDPTSVKTLMVLFVSSTMVLIVILAVSLKKRKTNKK